MFKSALAILATIGLAVASFSVSPQANASVSAIASSFQVPDKSLGFLLHFEEGDLEAEQSAAAFQKASEAAPLLNLQSAKAIGLGWYVYNYGIENPAKSEILAAVNASLRAQGVIGLAFDFKVEAAKSVAKTISIPAVKTYGLAPATSSLKLANGFDRLDPTNAKIKVQWKRPTSAAKRYQVVYSTGRYGPWSAISVTSSSSRPSATITGLTPGTKYYVKVRVRYSSTRYSSYTSPVSTTPLVQPLAVKLITNPRVTSATSISAQWFPLSTNAERGGSNNISYRMDVYRTATNTLVGSCALTVQTYCTKSGLTQDDYYAKVVAKNEVAETATSGDAQDFEYQSLWYLTGTNGINVKPAWALAEGGDSAVTVAVIDTGFTNAAVLKANSWWDDKNNRFYGYDFVANTPSSPSNDGNGADADPTDPGDYEDCTGCESSWHGTQVASVLAGYTNVNPNVISSELITSNKTIGVAPRVKLLAVRALGPSGGTTSEITAAINWAVGVQIPGYPLNIHPAKVVNLSMGTSSAQTCESYDNTHPSPSPSATALTTAQKFQNQITYTQDAITAAKAAGVIFVTAAGNYGGAPTYMRAYNSYPGNCGGTINVGATGKNGDRAWYSNRGSGFADYSGIDLSAPGGDSSLSNTRDDSNNRICDQESCITVIINSGTTSATNHWDVAVNQGTSFASPVVAGVVALMVSLDPTLTIDSVVEIFASTSTSFSNGTTCKGNSFGTYYECGIGIVNASAAVQAVADSLATR